ncbi:predicted protein [Naegleria gruberi]|uniref:Predicted protein n=1 Tax=Naegleria gruberi TaxID=5762 RepID=D2UYH2_NAEGR|nr:uncharacterized protein NAEGRDRAFT_45175 [Naegleria gruberi]EFC50475.1 predicted protein [Naegleria gruberi]|eukprot:XP_002683219.1 predicted protein [Naegleria gruberi strain NEG-M]
MNEQVLSSTLSHFESLFEVLLEKQQETSEQLQEIISERNSIWHEKIIPKIEQLYYKKREFHLNNEFLSLKSNRMDSLVKELIGREDEKQNRLIETRNIVKDKFQDLFKLIGMEMDYLHNLSNSSKIGEDAKIFLKIPKNLDTEGRIDYLLNNVEENIRNEYKDKNQLKYYEIGKKFVEYFNQRENEKIRKNNKIVLKEQKDKPMNEKLNQLRGFIEDTFHFSTRKKSE